MSIQARPFAAVALFAAAAALVCWAGCGRANPPQRSAAQGEPSANPEGGPTVYHPTPAPSTAHKRPPLDENLPAKIETITFAVG